MGMSTGKRLFMFAALAALLALAGCVTGENSLSPNDVAGMQLAGVTVGFEPSSRFSTPDSEDAYAAANGIPQGQMLPVLRTPEYQEFVRNMIAPRIKAGVEQAMAGRMYGSR